MRMSWNPKQRSNATWALDFQNRENLALHPGRLDPAGFRATTGVKVTVTASALINAVSVTVTALPGYLPVGAVIDLGGGKFIKLAAEAYQYATTLTTEALPKALAGGEIGYWNASNIITVPAGTFVGRTSGEITSKSPYGLWASGDAEGLLTMNDCLDVRMDQGVTFYRPGARIIAAYLPGWADLSGTVQTAILAAYTNVNAWA